MSGLSGLGGISAGLSTAKVDTQLQIFALKKQLDTSKFLGEAAVKLIQSASVDPNIGRYLDIRG